MARQKLTSQIEIAEAKLAILECVGEDDFTEGEVLQFTQEFGGVPYTYAAVKAAGQWWITGRYSGSYSWDALLALLASSRVTEIWWATSWDQIL